MARDARGGLDRRLVFNDGDPGDRPRAHFDLGVAFSGYGLLFVSPFLMGMPAVAGLALACAHRNDAHPLMRSHYDNQSRLFWSTLAVLLISLLLMIGGGGVAIIEGLRLLSDQAGAQVEGWSTPYWLLGGYGDDTARSLTDGLRLGGVVLAGFSVVRLMLGAVMGCLSLARGETVGWKEP